MTQSDIADDSSDGVFRFMPPIAGGADAVSASACVHVATKTVRDKAAFLVAFASALDFPDYFGQNWDAFYDCLTDLTQRYRGGLIIVLDDLSGFARSEPEEFNAALDAMIDATEFWRERGAKLTVLVGIDQPVLAPELREIRLRRPE